MVFHFNSRAHLPFLISAQELLAKSALRATTAEKDSTSANASPASATETPRRATNTLAPVS